MTSTAPSQEAYLANLPPDRGPAVEKLVAILNKNLPKGFEPSMGYGMPYWVVPKSIYPAGYHCDPKLPLGFIGLANQKNFIALYHMGIYADKNLLDWFVAEYPKHCKTKLDMGKSCIRFKKPDDIPYDLIKELAKKVTVKQWIDTYEAVLNRGKK